MGVIGVLSTIINLPVFWFVNNLHLNCKIEKLLILIPSLAFRFIAPMLALIKANGLTLLKIRQTNNQMEELTDQSVSRKAEHRLIRKVLAIVGLFICCHIITVCLNFSLFFVPSTLFNNALADVFVVLNSSMNITIYCGFDRKFRQQLKNMVCCCFDRNKDKNKTILGSIPVVKYSAESQV